jgi:hypothetical protein
MYLGGLCVENISDKVAKNNSKAEALITANKNGNPFETVKDLLRESG